MNYLVYNTTKEKTCQSFNRNLVYNFKLQWYTLFVKKDAIVRPVCKPAVAQSVAPLHRTPCHTRGGGIGIIVGRTTLSARSVRIHIYVEGRKRA